MPAANENGFISCSLGGDHPVSIGGVCTSLQAQQVVNRWSLNPELNYQEKKFCSFTK